jgi:hypothetical protein
MKLEIELVPSTAWYSNMRKAVTRDTWDKIRKECYRKAGYSCELCSIRKVTLHCHEIWNYDDKKHIQTLEGFICLCQDCHWIKHIGLAGIKASEGVLDMENLIKHFMKVNGVEREIFEKHKEEAFNIWEKRSNHDWKTDLSKWSHLTKS